MSEIVQNTRAFLRLFEQSGRRDLYLRSGDYHLFVARHDGGANPMREGVAATSQLLAPHVSTFEWAAPVGSVLAAGDPVARLLLLDETIELLAEHAGSVASIEVEHGQLLEYGDPILTIR